MGTVIRPVGDGYGDGDGDGDGKGKGYGIKSFNGQEVHIIDGVQTIIKKVRRNIATGFIVQNDLTLKKCFVARIGDYFAHGSTIAEAIRDAESKQFEDFEPEERIAEFRAKFNMNDSYTGHEFFEWHQRLTGSCEMGRAQFVKDQSINLDQLFTVREFVELVRGSYGSDITNQLLEQP
jgi:hypothetical protein